MYKRKKLKLKEPFSKTYQHHGYQTGILLAHINCIEYLYSQYVQVFYSIKDKKMEYDHSFFFSDDQAFIQYFCTFPMEYVSNGDIIECIKDFIKQDKYVYGNWNEYHISLKKRFHQYNFLHNFLIYGFDDEKEVFLAVGYIHTGFWQEYEVTYREACDALYDENNHNVNLQCFDVNRYFNKSFEYDLFKTKLNQYYNSTEVYNNFEPGPCIGGLNAWHEFIVNECERMKLKEIGKKESYFLFSEYKELMINRLEYFRRQGGYDINLDWISGYTKLLYESKRTLNLVLKFNMQRDITLIDRIYNAVEYNIESERSLLEKVLVSI
ncbi:MAG: hypothetical protein PHC56_11890 [Herbinix sp.]|nr:hypothetical protein [Herbinix sp.]